MKTPDELQPSLLGHYAGAATRLGAIVVDMALALVVIVRAIGLPRLGLFLGNQRRCEPAKADSRLQPGDILEKQRAEYRGGRNRLPDCAHTGA